MGPAVEIIGVFTVQAHFTQPVGVFAANRPSWSQVVGDVQCGNMAALNDARPGPKSRDLVHRWQIVEIGIFQQGVETVVLNRSVGIRQYAFGKLAIEELAFRAVAVGIVQFAE